MKSSLLSIACAGSMLLPLPGSAQDRFPTQLDFCRTVITDMPDPAAPSFYRALPTASTMTTGAGWSGHVHSWFNYMRSGTTGGAQLYLAHRKSIASAAEAYERSVLDRGTPLVAESRRAGFKKSLLDLQAQTRDVIPLTNKYTRASGELDVEFERLKQALLGIREARSGLEAVEKDYAAFLDKLVFDEKLAEKEKLIADAKEVHGVVSLVLGSMSSAPGLVPYDATSIMKALGGQPVGALVNAALRPDAKKLAELDARLARLDAEIKQHRDKAFRSRIDAARAKLERSQIDPVASGKAILTRKLEGFQAVQELAGLEKEGQGFQYFHMLRDYFKDVALAASRLDEAADGYYRFLTRGRPAEAALLLRHIEVDIDHVRSSGAPDPSGEWARVANDAATWLRRDFIPWHKAEVERVGRCVTGFKELRHLQLVDESLNGVTEALGGVPRRDVGKYRF
jgi:hypothetical protein